MLVLGVQLREIVGMRNATAGVHFCGFVGEGDKIPQSKMSKSFRNVEVLGKQTPEDSGQPRVMPLTFVGLHLTRLYQYTKLIRAFANESFLSNRHPLWR
jgi:hypothetical protein